MQSVVEYLRLGVSGLFLEQRAYDQQRDAPDGLKRGFILVVLIGFTVGLCTLIGQIIESLASPNDAAVAQTIYAGVTAMPWYEQATENVPGFAENFRRQFDQGAQAIQLLFGRSLLQSGIGFLFAPFAYLLGWLVFGCFAHLMARLLGGRATLRQTLGCTALASGVQLLAAVQLFPFAQVAGTTLLSLVANYVAIRTAHGLPPWRAFWATILGPLLLVLLFACAFCVIFFSISSAVGSGR